MWRCVPAATALVLLGVACGGGGGEPTATATPTPTPTVRAVLGPAATPRTGEGTATPGYPGELRRGVWVRVVGTEDCLNFRAGPSSEDYTPVNFCRPDGFEGYLAGDPVLSDGRWWWFVAGNGWAADEFLELVREEALDTRVISGLTGLGQIAYIGRDRDLWVMNADGSGRRRLVDIDPGAAAPKTIGVGNPQWSPDGLQIMFEAFSYSETEGEDFRVRIVDLQGELVREFPEAGSASWSPEGRRLAYLHEMSNPGCGHLRGKPVVVDLSTGARRPVGPEGVYAEGPKWRPNGAELTYQDQDGIHLARADGSGSQLIAEEPECSGAMPNWAPDGDRISLRSSAADCAGYLVYRLSSHRRELCAPGPPLDPLRGGRHGSPEDGQTDWSPDGRRFAYHTEFAVTNRNGVYVVDSRTGAQTLLPGWDAYYPGFAPNSRHVAFSTYGPGGGFVWIGDVETGKVVLLAEGSQASWRPGP